MWFRSKLLFDVTTQNNITKALTEQVKHEHVQNITRNSNLRGITLWFSTFIVAHGILNYWIQTEMSIILLIILRIFNYLRNNVRISSAVRTYAVGVQIWDIAKPSRILTVQVTRSITLRLTANVRAQREWLVNPQRFKNENGRPINNVPNPHSRYFISDINPIQFHFSIN